MVGVEYRAAEERACVLVGALSKAPRQVIFGSVTQQLH